MYALIVSTNRRKQRTIKYGPWKIKKQIKRKKKSGPKKIIKNKQNHKRRGARRSPRGDVTMYCPRAGLAYCVFLHTSFGCCVWNVCVRPGYCLCLMFLCVCILWLGCIQHWWYCVSSSLLTLSLDGGVKVHYNHFILWCTVSLGIACVTIHC